MPLAAIAWLKAQAAYAAASAAVARARKKDGAPPVLLHPGLVAKHRKTPGWFVGKYVRTLRPRDVWVKVDRYAGGLFLGTVPFSEDDEVVVFAVGDIIDVKVRP